MSSVRRYDVTMKFLSLLAILLLVVAVKCIAPGLSKGAIPKITTTKQATTTQATTTRISTTTRDPKIPIAQITLSNPQIVCLENLIETKSDKPITYDERKICQTYASIGWSIHGLWEVGSYKNVEDEASEWPKNIDEILNSIWPTYGKFAKNKEFWDYEWTKHGKKLGYFPYPIKNRNNYLFITHKIANKYIPGLNEIIPLTSDSIKLQELKSLALNKWKVEPIFICSDTVRSEKDEKRVSSTTVSPADSVGKKTKIEDQDGEFEVYLGVRSLQRKKEEDKPKRVQGFKFLKEIRICIDYVENPVNTERDFSADSVQATACPEYSLQEEVCEDTVYVNYEENAPSGYKVKRE